MGMSPDEIVPAYPMLTLSDVHRALAYYYDNRKEIDASIRDDKDHAAALKAKAGLSLVEQKLRQRKADASGDSI